MGLERNRGHERNRGRDAEVPSEIPRTGWRGARQGIAALMTATNIAYCERERRGFFRQAAISLGFTLAAVIGFLVMLLFPVAAGRLCGRYFGQDTRMREEARPAKD